MFDSLAEMIPYHSMIGSLVKREVRGRYKGSVLGFLWNFIIPLVQILVYIMVFTLIFRSNLEHYYAYLIAGMVPWIMICDSLVSGAGSIIDNSQLVSKIYFPRAIIPVSVVVSKFVNFLISIGITTVVLLATGHGLDPVALLFLPVAVLILLVFCIGASLVLSAANVFMRDVQYMVNVVMMVWIWLTPIMYARTDVRNDMINLFLDLNPITYLVRLFQDIFYWKTVPDPSTFVIAALIAVVAMFAGAWAYDRYSYDFAEVM